MQEEAKHGNLYVLGNKIKELWKSKNIARVLHDSNNRLPIVELQLAKARPSWGQTEKVQNRKQIWTLDEL